MTTFVYSRPRVALGLATLPVVAPYAIFREAFIRLISATKQVGQEFREDVMPAFRYVLTGNADKTVVAATVAKAASVRKSIGQSVSDFYEAHVMYRLYGLLALLLFPILATVIAFYELEETGFFDDAWSCIKGAGRTVVSGRDRFA